MSARDHEATGFVLTREERGESQWHFALLDPSAGTLWFVQRKPRKGGLPLPDLFDRVRVVFAQKGEGPGFVRDLEILSQSSALARNYEAFAAAGRLGRILLSNGRHWHDHATPSQLLERSVCHWSGGAPASLIYFKALFLIAQAEGLPVRAQWLAGLPAALAAPARAALAAPPAAGDVSGVPPRLITHLESWLRVEGHFDIPP